MAKKTFRVKAEGALVLGKTHGQDVVLDDELYNVEALIAGGIVEPAKSSEKAKEQ